jgi:hypothetical protein
MMFGVAAALLLPVAAMFFVLSMCFPAGRLAWFWRLTLAAGLGTGVSALTWGAMLIAAGPSRHTAIAIDAGLWSAIVLAGAWHRGIAVAHSSPVGQERSYGVALAVFVAAVATAAVAFYAHSTALPHGNWDAWAIWNLKARFIERGAADGAWIDLFNRDIAWSHPDYPLLLPWLIARGWTYAGRETVAVPIAYAALFSAGTVAVLVVSIARLRHTGAGLLAGAFLAAAPAFVTYGPVQCADVPLAFFLVTTVTLIAEAERAQRPSGWLLAGLAAGLGAWTKNEGAGFWIVSVMVFVGWVLLRSPRGRGRGPLLMVAASAPLVLALAVFKSFVGVENDVVNVRTLPMLFTNIIDAERVTTVLSAVGMELWNGGAEWVGVLPILGLYVLVRGGYRSREAVVGRSAAVITIMLAAYTAVYVQTPLDLRWHLQTSVDRLLLQLLPAIIWIGSMAAEPPLMD